MRRPLMAVCMCFVIITWLLLSTDNLQHEETIPYNSRVVVAGHVYRKDIKSFYLDSVSIEVQAADQQQNFSFDQNLICDYDTEAPCIGSEVIVEGTFRSFQGATNPGEFDAKEYYASIGVGGRIVDITEWSSGEHYHRLKEALYDINSYFRARLYQVFPQKEASVMAAMLLGDKSELDEEVKSLYQENGIIHILSISGLHISIIGMSLFKTLHKTGCPVWLAAIVGGGVLVLYGMMTGMSVSACRAIGMFLIKMLAEITGRTYDMLTALALCGAIMAGNNPEYLKNAGFLLSYASILGIGVLYPALLPPGKKMGVEVTRLSKLLRKAEESLLASVSITLTTLPIQLWFYYEVPIYSVFLNLLVLPLMSPVMLSGLWTMLVPGFGFVGTVDCVILRGYEWLCKAFEELPYAKWNPGRPEGWMVCIYYGILLGLVWIHAYLQENRPEPRKKHFMEAGSGICRIVTCTVLMLAVLILGINFPGETTVTFLDVGQGDCICVQLKSGEVYLFDCGSTSRSKIGEYVLKPYLKYKGITHIDGVFVSHPDADHCNGIMELLQHGEEWGISIAQLFLSATTADGWQELLEQEGVSRKREIVHTSVGAGDCWKVGENEFYCLHPPRENELSETITDTNAFSQCFYVRFQEGTTLLLTGDAELEGEEALLKELQKLGFHELTLLKVAHHGSRNATGAELLQQTKPKVAVISCGSGNSYGHPHMETLARLEEAGTAVISTMEYGAVTVRMGKGRITIAKAQKESKPPRSSYHSCDRSLQLPLLLRIGAPLFLNQMF